eukprot:TRINITY_DN105754_c0_g1_i1.p1 TRINITY_DN105754_c0_g1~~TRINITY_DN105754_c0_g1_i1.p1  ORF type:complete len:313 (-),score=48.59 TRINITY_DN105754_c0_g1_i1:86-1024(-)
MDERLGDIDNRVSKLAKDRQLEKLDAEIKFYQNMLENETRREDELENLLTEIEFFPVVTVPRRKKKADDVPPRAYVILDRDNRGQKFFNDVHHIPDNMELHVIYNPTSKHPFATNPQGAYFKHENKCNEKEGNAAVLAWVAGKLCEEAPPDSTFYFAFLTEHQRHEESQALVGAEGFDVVKVSVDDFSLGDIISWEGHNPHDFCYMYKASKHTPPPLPSQRRQDNHTKHTKHHDNEYDEYDDGDNYHQDDNCRFDSYNDRRNNRYDRDRDRDSRYQRDDRNSRYDRDDGGPPRRGGYRYEDRGGGGRRGRFD